MYDSFFVRGLEPLRCLHGDIAGFIEREWPCLDLLLNGLPPAARLRGRPYYRYTKLKNGLSSNELVLFGLVKMSDSVAVTYELPVLKTVDYSDVREFKQGATRNGTS